ASARRLRPSRSSRRPGARLELFQATAQVARTCSRGPASRPAAGVVTGAANNANEEPGDHRGDVVTVTELARRKSSVSAKHLLKRVILPIAVFLPLGYFFPKLTLFYAVCGIYDVARNRNIDGGVLQRYFLGNGIATWLLSPFNILMDILCLPYVNK